MLSTMAATLLCPTFEAAIVSQERLEDKVCAKKHVTALVDYCEKKTYEVEIKWRVLPVDSFSGTKNVFAPSVNSFTSSCQHE